MNIFVNVMVDIITTSLNFAQCIFYSGNDNRRDSKCYPLPMLWCGSKSREPASLQKAVVRLSTHSIFPYCSRNSCALAATFFYIISTGGVLSISALGRFQLTTVCFFVLHPKKIMVW